jgi:hypothetical protein
VKDTLRKVARQHFFYNSDVNYAAEQLEVFRIGIALFSLVSFITLLLDYHIFFAPDGLINWEVTNANSFWFELHPEKIAALTGLGRETTILTIIYLYLTSLILLLLGIWPRVSAIVALILFVTLSNTLSPYGYGVDVYHTVNLFLLCIFPTGYLLSVRTKASALNTKAIREMSVRVLQLYIGLTYLNAGVEKAFMPNWWNGKFIYYLINDPTMMVRTHFINSV